MKGHGVFGIDEASEPRNIQGYLHPRLSVIEMLWSTWKVAVRLASLQPADTQVTQEFYITDSPSTAFCDPLELTVTMHVAATEQSPRSFTSRILDHRHSVVQGPLERSPCIWHQYSHPGGLHPTLYIINIVWSTWMHEQSPCVWHQYSKQTQRSSSRGLITDSQSSKLSSSIL